MGEKILFWRLMTCHKRRCGGGSGDDVEHGLFLRGRIGALRRVVTQTKSKAGMPESMGRIISDLPRSEMEHVAATAGLEDSRKTKKTPSFEVLRKRKDRSHSVLTTIPLSICFLKKKKSYPFCIFILCNYVYKETLYRAHFCFKKYKIQ